MGNLFLNIKYRAFGITGGIYFKCYDIVQLMYAAYYINKTTVSSCVELQCVNSFKLTKKWTLCKFDSLVAWDDQYSYVIIQSTWKTGVFTNYFQTLSIYLSICSWEPQNWSLTTVYSLGFYWEHILVGMKEFMKGMQLAYSWQENRLNVYLENDSQCNLLGWVKSFTIFVSDCLRHAYKVTEAVQAVFGLVWFWFGLVWFGLVWFWFGLV